MPDDFLYELDWPATGDFVWCPRCEARVAIRNPFGHKGVYRVRCHGDAIEMFGWQGDAFQARAVEVWNAR